MKYVQYEQQLTTQIVYLLKCIISTDQQKYRTYNNSCIFCNIGIIQLNKNSLSIYAISISYLHACT